MAQFINNNKALLKKQFVVNRTSETGRASSIPNSEDLEAKTAGQIIRRKSKNGNWE